MIRLPTILLFLGVAILSVIAIPTPTVDTSNPFTLRQATRADIVNKRHASPVRRQGPSPLPIRPFRIRVPTNAATEDYAGLYFVNTNVPQVPAPFTAATINAEAELASGATIYQISPTGRLQASNDLTMVAVASTETTADVAVVLFLTPDGATNFGAGELTCSIGTDSVLACTDPASLGRTVGLLPNLLDGNLAFALEGVLPVAVEYL